MHLFAMNHKDFDECLYDAQKLDDNCDLPQVWTRETSSIASEEAGNPVNANTIADAIIRKMKHESRNMGPYRPYPLRQQCETCGEIIRQNVVPQQIL